MDYRSPVLSMQRELEMLEAELAALRALPEPHPKPPPLPSKKAKAAAERERRALQSQLAKLENRLRAAGLPTVVSKRAAGVGLQRFALGCVALGALVFSVHL